MPKVLLIEDDINIRESVKQSLQQHGFVVDAVEDGSEGHFLISNYNYDLLVVDWNLPGMQGIEIIRQLRDSGKNTRTLMLTAHTDLTDKLDAFNSGVDDYLCKPFESAELVVRLQALLRRPESNTTNKLLAEQIELDTSTREVTCAGKSVKLNPTELAILEFFLKHQGHVVTAETLLDNCWKSMSETTEGAVRFHISGLRKKIDHDRIPGSYIETVHGAGYRFVSNGSGKKPGRSTSA